MCYNSNVGGVLLLARLKACSYCGKIHKGDCARKPKDYHVKQDKIRKFRKSTEWTKCRERILERDEYCCQICLAKGHITSSQSLHVHHIVPLQKNWDMRIDERNLISLCSEHHTDVHNNLYSQIDIQNIVNKKYND